MSGTGISAPVLVAVISFTGVVVTALVTWLIAQRRIAAEQVTAQRANWRKKIRAQALHVRDGILKPDQAEVARLRSEFMALLSPFDEEDIKLLSSIAVVDCDDKEERERKAEEFTKRVALLLKHDWERAKLEAGFFLCHWIWEAERHPLDRFGDPTTRKHRFRWSCKRRSKAK